MGRDQTRKPRPRCQYLLAYGGRRFCKHVWIVKIMAEASELPFGCPEGCEHYHAAYPTMWEPEVPEADVPSGIDPPEKHG